MTNVPSSAAPNAGNGAMATVPEILDDMRNGRMVVLVDAEDRENEGDLVIPAQMATPDAVNFMAKYGRGLICLALTQSRANELGLENMVRSNASRLRTAFTQSIEAREGITTGISAYDRARTIATAIDPSKSAEDIVSPGHVFPLVAREGGVLIRAGHTEASVDLSSLAGLFPAAVICEIMNDDGSMARVPDLIPFAEQHGLRIGTIESLIAYRLQNDRLVEPVAQTSVVSKYGGDFDLHVFTTTVEPVEHIALVKGDLTQPGPVLVRVHAVNAASDLLGIGEGLDQETTVAKSIRAISKADRGVIVLIRDLAPTIVSDWVKNRAMPEGEQNNTGRRQVEIGVGSQILRSLGVRDMTLLTNSPAHVYVGLDAFGLRIVGTQRLEP